MYELQLFTNSKLGQIRVVIRNGEPWFVATDVCKILGVRTNNLQHIFEQDEHSRLGNTSDFIKLCANILLVSEPGLYHLILVSRKPEAKPFRKWVVSKILPEIRKTGRYILGKALSTNHEIPMTLPEALRAYALILEKNDELRIANSD